VSARPCHRNVCGLDPASRRAARRPGRSRPGPRAGVPALPPGGRADPARATAVGRVVAAPDRRPHPRPAADPGAGRADRLRRGGRFLTAARRGARTADGVRAGRSRDPRTRAHRELTRCAPRGPWLGYKPPMQTELLELAVAIVVIALILLVLRRASARSRAQA